MRPGYNFTDFGICDRSASLERSEIPPLAMADHRLVFADGEDEACQVVRSPRTIHEPHDSYSKAGAVAITYVDGWTDVRFPADDVDRLWANAKAEPSTAVHSRGAYNSGERIKKVLSECFPDGAPPRSELSNPDLLRRVFAKHAELFKDY
jgi:hypothetical protein